MYPDPNITGNMIGQIYRISKIGQEENYLDLLNSQPFVIERAKNTRIIEFQQISKKYYYIFFKSSTFGYNLCFVSDPNYVIVCNPILTEVMDIDIVVVQQNRVQETSQFYVYISNSILNKVDLYLLDAEKPSKEPFEPIKTLTDKSLGLGTKFCPISLHVGFKTPELLYIGSSCQGFKSYIVQYWMSMDILLPGANLVDLEILSRFDFCDFND